MRLTPRGRATRLSCLTAALFLSGGLAGCGGASDASPAARVEPPGPGDGVVRLVGLDFEPKSITINAGKRVVWRWTDQVVHNVIGEPDVRSLNQNGGSYAYTYAKAGTYRYQCTLHVGMTGTVVVQP